MPFDEIVEETIGTIVSVESLRRFQPEDLAECMVGKIVARSAETVTDDSMSSACKDEPHGNDKLANVIECMLFVSPDPLSAEHMGAALGIEPDRVLASLVDVECRLESSGLQLMRVAGGYQLCTRPEYSDYCALILQPSTRRLSKAALETLAVIAYRQPCTVPEIEAVRGVSLSGIVRNLAERGLVKEAGRKRAPGRPMLYVTTPEFLQYFGLDDLSDLPDLDAPYPVDASLSEFELFQGRE